MSGIAGIVRFDGQRIAPERSEAMLRNLRHLGPDGEGIYSNAGCVLVHARLSIIDPSHGNQPMTTVKDDREPGLAVVFNGEVFNHVNLRRRLERFGHRFRSDHSDTEVLLHGYRQWGTDLPGHLRGKFAFAIWDEQRRELFLCRDHTGQMPLHLHLVPTGDNQIRQLIFGNLVTTIVAGMEDAGAITINTDAVLTYLRFGVTDHTSLISGIEEIQPAHWMLVDASGQIAKKRYWQLPPASKSTTTVGVVGAVESVLTDAVRSHLDADVPLGCWLSGGLDSALIAGICQRERIATGGESIQTWGVAIPDLAYDVSAHTSAIARSMGTNHTELVADSGADVIADLENLVRLSGEPIADKAILASYWLCRTLRDHTRVVLSGNGGDELFGGYERYRAMRVLAQHQWWLRRLPARTLGRLSGAEQSLVRKLLNAASDDDPARQYQSLIFVFSDDEIKELGLSPSANTAETSNWIRDWPDEDDPVHAAMRWDLTHKLPFDLLRRLDRASMGFGIELRCPMLDTRVCDLAAHLPRSVLMPKNEPKGLLRRLADDLLPATVPEQTQDLLKVPLNEWFRESLKQPLHDRLVYGQLSNVGIDRYAIEQMLEDHHHKRHDHASKLFALLTLSIWMDWFATVKSGGQTNSSDFAH